jgi:hypothetical protein
MKISPSKNVLNQNVERLHLGLPAVARASLVKKKTKKKKKLSKKVKVNL